MPPRVRDLIVLFAVAVVARAVAVVLVPWPPFTDPAYYSLVAEQLAEGHGFTIPVLYSFLEVGSQIPDPAVLPVPSNGHWMPLTSIVAAGAMALFGPSYVAGTLPLIVLSAALVPFTYWLTTELGGGRGAAIAAGVLAIFAGPLLIMYPTTDNFAVFGVAGAASLYASTRAVSAERPGPWIVAGGALAALATLARIDGVLLTLAVATAWFVRRGWSPWRPERTGGATLGWGLASAVAFVAVVAPWLARNAATYGTPLPSTGGHTLWITSYNEQFSIGHEVSLSTYLDWGWANIIGSKIYAFGELIGRTGVLLGGTFLVFFVAGAWMRRRDPRIAPFLVYFVVMFAAMALLFTFHAPRGAFYHSAPAWLPWALAIAVMAVGPSATTAGRFWPFLRRPETHRFLTVVGVAGAVVLSVVGSVILYRDWDHSRVRDEETAAFLLANAERSDVVMASDPASLYPLSGNPAVAAPFDPFPVIEEVVDAYGVDWVVVLSPGDGERDPLGLWDGAAGVDSEGNHPTFLPEEPAFEGTDLRIFRVER
jgi:4-amino-4-deoxy-L-arabinose transferase-like glycosyltransferase